jgi:protocatechuate 3,4-dioxygenase beta subunit
VREPPRLLVLALFCSALAGAGRLAAQNRPGQPQQPTRDTSALIRRGTGTASISGQVTTLDTGRPIKQARVSLSGAELPEGRAVMTDEDGRYNVANLPAGRFTISVSKPGFITVAYGQRRPGRSGRPLPVADGQRVRSLDFRMPRGSVVTGHVFDEDGEPLLGAQVRALRYYFVQGERRLVSTGAGVTDDRGEFRIFGLVPGTYYVAASFRPSEPFARATVAVAAGDAAAGTAPAQFAPTYFPGVTNAADATPITVGLQAEAPSIDFGLQLVPAARVSGAVTGPEGAPASGGSVTLSPDDAAMAGQSLGANYSSSIRTDGSFLIQNVPPGRYAALARGPGARGRDLLFAVQSVVVSGSDVPGVNLTLTTGSTISGTVSFDGGASASGDLSRLRVALSLLSSLPIPVPSASGVLVDGTFTLSPVVAGSYLVRVSGLPQGSSLKNVSYGGRDVADYPFDVRVGQNIGGLAVVITNRATEITGTVPDSEGQPLPDCTVIAFSADASNWRPQSRYIQVSRSDPQGQFHIRGLPPGDYLVAAVDDVESGEWFDPTYLDGLRRSGVRVSLSEGETKSVEPKLATGQ